MNDDHELSEEDLKDHLEEQLGFLERSADAFDRGFEGEAKRLAVTLRVLIHDTASSHSLLTQLGLKGDFVDTAGEPTPGNLATTHSLIGITVAEDGPRYVPLLDVEGAPDAPIVPFDKWWSTAVFIDQDGRRLSRRDLVLTAANKDGGAHVDPKLTVAYAALSRRNSLGWKSFGGADDGETLKNPERAAIRQIAHETLKTLRPGYQKRSDRPLLAHLSITEAPPEGPETGSSPAMQIRQPEISNGKMRFFPEVGEFYFKNDPVSYPVQDEEYVFEVVIDSITQGSIYGVVGGILTMPFMTPGQHAVRVRAGPDKEVGVLGQNTDAVIDRVSVRQVRSN